MVRFRRELTAQKTCMPSKKRSDRDRREEVDYRPGDYFVPKRRYSAFYGTDLEILLKGLKAKP